MFLLADGESDGRAKRNTAAADIGYRMDSRPRALVSKVPSNGIASPDKPFFVYYVFYGFMGGPAIPSMSIVAFVFMTVAASS